MKYRSRISRTTKSSATLITLYIILLVGLLCVLSALTVLAQSPAEKQVIPPSPNAASIAKYGNTPVSYYTGLVNIEVPIYTIHVRDIVVPVSLSYHAGGIKVSEEASRVGLGWSLNCGGQISRNIINEDDFNLAPTGYLSPQNNSTPLPTGPSYTKQKIVESGAKVTFGKVSQSGVTEVDYDLTDFIYGSTVDYEPDHFNYNFMGYSGKFIMARDRTPVFEKQVKMSMVPDLAGNTWEVKTADGFQYMFERSEYFVDYQTSGGQQISAWYLTKIKSVQGEEVTFHYQVLPGDQFTKPAGAYQQRHVAMSLSCEAFPCTMMTGRDAPLPRKKYSTIYLSAITWKLGKLEFSMTNREDIDGDLRLVGAKIFSRLLAQGEYELQQEYRLEQSYFDYPVESTGFSTPDVTPDHLRKRLRLDAVAKYSPVGADAEWKYRLAYYQDQPEHRLPPKNSFSRDHWGFYNGVRNTSLIPTHQVVASAIRPSDLVGVIGNERNPSSEHMKAFSLRSITYPTGGTTTFSYEPHEYELDPTTASSGASQVTEQFLYDCHENAGQVKSILIDLSDEYASEGGMPIPVEISGIFRSNESCSSLNAITDVYFEIVREDNTSLVTRITPGAPPCTSPGQTGCISCGEVAAGILNYNTSLVLPPGKYFWRAFVPADEERFENISMSLKWWADNNKRSPLDPNASFAIAGGLRISQISDFDPVAGRTHSRKFIYRQLADINGDGIKEQHSTGKLMSVPRYSYFDIFWETRRLGPLQIPSSCLECVTLFRQSDSFVPATGSQGFAVGYSRVAEVNGSVELGGWTEYEYFNEKDVPIVVYHPHGQNLYPIRASAIPTTSSRRNGLLKQKTFYRADSVPVMASKYTYAQQYLKTYFGLETRRINAIGFGSSEYNAAWATLGNRADLLTITYPTISSGLEFPETSTEVHYDSAGNPTFTKTTTSSYDNPAHLQLTKSTFTTSDSRVHSVRFKYASDFPNSETNSAVRRMAGTKHLHSAPIEETQTDDTDPGHTSVLGRTITLYKEVNDLVLPGEIADLNVPEPLSSADVSPFIPALLYDSNVYRLSKRFHYSSDGNVTQVSSVAAERTSYLWGHSGALPLAEVRNAANNSFKTEATVQSSELISLSIGGGGSNISKSYTFTTDYDGTVYLKLGVAGTPEYNTIATYTGITAGTTTLATGGCGSTVIPFVGLRAGTYTITISITTTGGEQVGACGEIEFPKFRVTSIQSGIVEYFYEGFEELLSISPDPQHSHTGLRFKQGDYTVAFNPPTPREFSIEYWFRDDDGTWHRAIKRYYGPTILTDGSGIDDVRIYPVGALMKTFTYGPHGVTSVIDESGKATIYDYDQYGRLSLVLDGDRNVLQGYEYKYCQD